MVVQKVEIQKPKGGRVVAIATLLLTSGAEFGGSSIRGLSVLDGDWSGRKTFFNASVGGGGRIYTNNSRRSTLEMQWSAQDVRKAPERDLIVSTFYSGTGGWPLEIAFPIKKDGKPIYGVVQPLTRPKNKPPLR